MRFSKNVDINRQTAKHYSGSIFSRFFCKNVLYIETPKFLRASRWEDLVHGENILKDRAGISNGKIDDTQGINGVRKAVLHDVRYAFPVVGNHYGEDFLVADKVEVYMGTLGTPEIFGLSTRSDKLGDHSAKLKNCDNGQYSREPSDPMILRRFVSLLAAAICCPLIAWWGITLADCNRWLGWSMVALSFLGFAAADALWFANGFTWSWGWWL